MKHLVIIAIAGALGAISRYGLVSWVDDKNFPWGTMTVNVLGSFLMGLAFVLIVEKGVVPEDIKPFVMTGFLGAFTTFSAFSLDAWQLLDRGEFLTAVAYVTGSVVICIVALFMGVLLARTAI